MKKIFTIIFCSLSLFLNAQHETILDNLDLVGAFGAPILEIGSINGQVGSDVGGGGALILNNIFIGGYGMGTEYPDFDIEDGENQGSYDIKFGHGGLWLGYNGRSYKVAHLFADLKIGWGNAQLKQDGEAIFRDRVFVMTPSIGVELNITDFFRISLTGGYRWVNGVSKLPGLENEDFSSPVGIISFNFGGFDDDWDWDW